MEVSRTVFVEQFQLYLTPHMEKKKETLTELLLIENSHTILLELLWAMVLLRPFLACDLGLLNQNVNTFNMSIFIVLDRGLYI